MRDLTKQERAAIEAVARRFSATWEQGSDPPDAYIKVAGNRVAVDIKTLKRRGNRVRIRLLRDESERAPKMIGFVHNSDSDPLLLLNMTAELLELISAEAGRRAPQLAGDRWLVVISAAGLSCLEAYRYIYSQLRPATDFKKTLMVFGDGHVGMLTG